MNNLPEIFSGLIFTTAQVVYITAMVIHMEYLTTKLHEKNDFFLSYLSAAAVIPVLRALLISHIQHTLLYIHEGYILNVVQVYWNNS